MITLLSIIGTVISVIYFFVAIKRYNVMEYCHHHTRLPDFHKERMNLTVGMLACSFLIIFNIALMIAEYNGYLTLVGLWTLGQFIQILQTGRMFNGLYLYPEKISDVK